MMRYSLFFVMLLISSEVLATHNCVQLKNKLAACEVFNCIDDQKPKKAVTKLERYKEMVASEGGDSQWVQDMYDESKQQQAQNIKTAKTYAKKYNFDITHFVDLEGIAEAEKVLYQRKMSILDQTASGLCHYVEKVQYMKENMQYECLLSYDDIHYLIQSEDDYLIRPLEQAPFFDAACSLISKETFDELTGY